MKKLYRWYLGILMCIITIIIVSIGFSYSQFVSKRIYKHSTSHLIEIYSQVSNSFKDFINKNHSILTGLNNHIHHNTSNNSEIADFVNSQQKCWNFSNFYFMEQDGNSITLDGKKEHIALKEASKDLLNRNMMVMEGETLSDGQAITIFVLSTTPAQYNDFDYNAIAVSYTNADLVNSLNVDAFSGESKCFVVDSEGGVLLSTQSGGSVFENYFAYLKAASNLDENTLQTIRSNWENNVSGLIRCQIGGISYYISYQSIDYQGYMLLGLVPENVASTSLLQIQKGTINTLIKIFLILGSAVVFYLIHHNRQKLLKSKLELQYRDLMFDTLSNSVEDILMMIDVKKRKIDYVSPNMNRLLGIVLPNDTDSFSFLEKIIEKDKDKTTLEMLSEIPIQGSKSWDREHMHHRTGEYHWYHETIYRKSIQGTEKFIIVMSDRTKERQIHRTLINALATAKSANEAKSHFLSNMSHDIRTPMNAIIGLTLLLEKDFDKPEKVKEYTKKISASSQHLLGLINDVLDMSKIESGKTSLNIEKFSLPEMLEEINTILLPQAKAKCQTFEIHVQGNPAEWLMGDKLRLNQILINLLSNSIKYTPDNGTITFTIEKLPQGKPRYNNLRFIISDNGFGMSEEFLKTIFEPFSREISSSTNKIQGTGLGMAITKNLVTLMGGIISVSSKINEGSTFTVELSFALPNQEEDDDLLWVSNKISRLLVADDEESVCQNIADLLKDSTIQVSCVSKGSDAVKEAILAKEQGRDYDVILLDWQMTGQNGVKTTQQIREQVGSDIPILVLTSYDWGEIEDEAKNAGVNAFMPKPFFISTFKQALSTIFYDDISSAKSDTNTDKDNVLNGLLFLVAEDIELNAEILSGILDMEGASCEIAVNGQMAVEMFEKSETGYYDMILMDVQMPLMDGYEATRQIRAGNHPEAKTIPIVAMTANAFAEDAQNALDSGMNAHLAKPIDMNAMRSLVSKILLENK